MLSHSRATVAAGKRIPGGKIEAEFQPAPPGGKNEDYRALAEIGKVRAAPRASGKTSWHYSQPLNASPPTMVPASPPATTRTGPAKCGPPWCERASTDPRTTPTGMPRPKTSNRQAGEKIGLGRRSRHAIGGRENEEKQGQFQWVSKTKEATPEARPQLQARSRK